MMVTISLLNKILISSQGFWDLKENSRNLLLDKCDLVCHFIHSGNRQKSSLEEYEPTPLNSNILKRHLGASYKKIITLLKELNIITTDGHYKPRHTFAKAISKQYNFTKFIIKNSKLISWKPRLKRTEKKIKKYRLEFAHKLIQNPINKSIIKSCNEVILPKQYKPKSQEFHYLRNLENLKKDHSFLQYLVSDHFHFSTSITNRKFHSIANVHKSLRRNLIHKDGENLVEIDLTNSQPLILGLEFNKTNHTSKYLMEDLLSGQFYSEIQDFGIINNTPIKDMTYKKIKTGILTVFYDKIYPKNCPIESALSTLYPEFMNWIENRKKTKGYKEICHLAQKIEASIFIFEYKSFAIPVHDSLLVRESEKLIYLNILVDRFHAKFPEIDKNKIKELFKIDH